MIAEWELHGQQLYFDQPEEQGMRWGVTQIDPSTGQPFFGARELSITDRFLNGLSWTLSDRDQLIVITSVAITALAAVASAKPDVVLTLKNRLMTQTQ